MRSDAPGWPETGLHGTRSGSKNSIAGFAMSASPSHPGADWNGHDDLELLAIMLTNMPYLSSRPDRRNTRDTARNRNAGGVARGASRTARRRESAYAPR